MKKNWKLVCSIKIASGVPVGAKGIGAGRVARLVSVAHGLSCTTILQYSLTAPKITQDHTSYYMKHTDPMRDAFTKHRLYVPTIYCKRTFT